MMTSPFFSKMLKKVLAMKERRFAWADPLLWHDSPEVTQLLNHGAQRELKDNSGKSAIDFASEKKHWEVVYHLILENKLHISYIDIC